MERINGLILWYNYDEDEEGWFWQDDSDMLDWPTSQLFTTKQEAIEIRKQDKLIWS